MNNLSNYVSYLVAATLLLLHGSYLLLSLGRLLAFANLFLSALVHLSTAVNLLPFFSEANRLLFVLIGQLSHHISLVPIIGNLFKQLCKQFKANFLKQVTNSIAAKTYTWARFKKISTKTQIYMIDPWVFSNRFMEGWQLAHDCVTGISRTANEKWLRPFLNRSSISLKNRIQISQKTLWSKWQSARKTKKYSLFKIMEKYFPV